MYLKLQEEAQRLATERRALALERDKINRLSQVLLQQEHSARWQWREGDTAAWQDFPIDVASKLEVAKMTQGTAWDICTYILSTSHQQSLATHVHLITLHSVAGEPVSWVADGQARMVADVSSMSMMNFATQQVCELRRQDP